MKTDLLLINPPYERLKGFAVGSLPNGILGLATYVNACGFSSLVYDADTSDDGGYQLYTAKNRAESQGSYVEALEDDNHPVWQEVKKTIEKYNPSYVGVSLMTPALHSALKVMAIAKELGKKVLIGGPHVNIVKEKAFNLDYWDYIFWGEAEFSAVEFLKAAEDRDKLKKIKGLGFIEDGRQVFTGKPDRIADLDSLPYPRRDYLLFKERYGKAELATIMASRGCPFSCTYCASVPIWGRKVAFRSAGHIIEEIKYLLDEFGINEFRFFDDTFTIKKKNLVDFCELLIENFGERYFSWWCLSHVSAINKDTLTLLQRAGCDQIQIGVESGSQEIVDRITKRMKLTDVEEAIALAKSMGMWVHTFFLIGLPYETRENMRQTINFLKKIKPDSINLCTFTPHPGTALYGYCLDKGLLEEDEDYEMYKYVGHHSINNYFLESVSREDFKEICLEIFALVAELNSRLNFRKLKYRLKTLSVSKLKRRILIYWNMFMLKLQLSPGKKTQTGPTSSQ
ncbi:MAG: radical SAM protein [Desulfobulbaceae bacterium]|nr:radical SAM protein [Desulfobulbaceae bacterium]